MSQSDYKGVNQNKALVRPLGSLPSSDLFMVSNFMSQSCKESLPSVSSRGTFTASPFSLGNCLVGELADSLNLSCPYNLLVHFPRVKCHAGNCLTLPTTLWAAIGKLNVVTLGKCCHNPSVVEEWEERKGYAMLHDYMLHHWRPNDDVGLSHAAFKHLTGTIAHKFSEAI